MHNWFKKFDKYWIPSEEESNKFLDEFTKSGIQKYGTDRDYPSLKGTSKLSPFIRNGQIHVSNIWEIFMINSKFYPFFIALGLSILFFIIYINKLI